MFIKNIQCLEEIEKEIKSINQIQKQGSCILSNIETSKQKPLKIGSDKSFFNGEPIKAISQPQLRLPIKKLCNLTISFGILNLKYTLKWRSKISQILIKNNKYLSD